jgi:hypothetical protein
MERHRRWVHGDSGCDAALFLPLFFADLAVAINASSSAGWAGRMSVADLRMALTGRSIRE